MLHLHRTLLAAPLLLSLACNVTVNGSASSDVTTDEDPSASSDPQTTNPTNPTTTPPTTTNDPSATGSSSGDPTTSSGGTTSATTTSAGETEGVGGVCAMTADCIEGLSCWAPYLQQPPMDGDFTCQTECVADGGSGNSNDVWCVDDDACCSEGVVCDDMGFCAPPPAETTGPETDSGTTGGTDSSTTDGTSTTGDSEGGTTLDTGTTGGGLQPLILLTGFEVFGDCMPVVPDDPISAKWTATFDNKLGMADYTATVSSASLTYDPGANEFVQGITVAPATSGVVGVGKTVMKAQSKTKALMNLPMDCNKCGKQVALAVVFTVDGQDVTATAETIMMCGL